MDIEYRPATEGDLELLMAWRSHPKLYRSLYGQDGPLTWEDHLSWWRERENRRDYIITVNEGERWRDVGVVTLTGLDTDRPAVGVWVGEVTLWGNGVATEAVEFAVDWLDDHGYPVVTAEIFEENSSSQHVFEKVGFTQVEHIGENRIEYEKNL